MRLRALLVIVAVMALALVVVEWERRDAEKAASADQQALVALREQAAVVDRLALSARFEVIANYDPLVAAVEDLRERARQLSMVTRGDPALVAFQQQLDRRTVLIDALKSTRAIERNSRAAVANAIEGPLVGAGDSPMVPQLAAWLLNPGAVPARDRLAHQLDEADATRPAMLTAHLHALLTASERLDRLTLDLLREPLATPAAALAASHLVIASESGSRSSWISLTLIALLVLTALGALWTSLGRREPVV